MNEERLLKILLAPHISEKTARFESQYVFKVVKDATKTQIKAAVEKLFDVNVKAVRISNVKGKKCRFGRILGKHSDWKKAYIILQKGQEIQIAS